MGELGARLIERAQRLVEAQRIDDAEARVGLHFEPLLVAEDHLLGRRLEQLQSRVVDIDAVDERRLDLQAGLDDDADRRAEADDQRLLALADDIERRGDEIDDGGGDDRQREKEARLHRTAPGAGAGVGCGAAAAGGAALGRTAGGASPGGALGRARVSVTGM